MRDSEFWTHLADTLETGSPVCLVIMVQAAGDGPNRPGARMLVTADANRFGTVGGGASEFQLAERAKVLLSNPPESGTQWITLQHSDSGKSGGSGMLCSGTQVFALTVLTPDQAEKIRTLASACENTQPVRFTLSAAGLEIDRASDNKGRLRFYAGQQRYSESVGTADTATLIGGGHVSLALSPLLTGLGMRVHVLDNRDGLKTMAENRFARERRVIDYEDIQAYIPEGRQSFVCIMTFAHQYDEFVLRRLIDMELRYLGMIGSLKKIKTIFEHLKTDGVPQAALNRVHAPIGLDIGSNTPEEIAVSIAAEIIALKNKRVKKGSKK